tara:strand:+ start:645 stop:1349 length:705 start_codon:yes stop_codon:yes gene_type:complete
MRLMDINICYIINNNEKYINLTLDSIYYIKKFFKSKKYNLKFYVISEVMINLPTDIINIISPYKNIPLLHQRLYISELLNIKKVIFLDSDTCITRCISKLWEINLNNNIVGCAKHYFFNDEEKFYHKYELNFKPFNIYSPVYFNCGVQLIDCVMWKNNNITYKMKRLYKELKHLDHPHYKLDEPVYNTILRGKIFNIDIKWNYYPVNDFHRGYLTHYYGINIKNKPQHAEFLKK